MMENEEKDIKLEKFEPERALRDLCNYVDQTD